MWVLSDFKAITMKSMQPKLNIKRQVWLAAQQQARPVRPVLLLASTPSRGPAPRGVLLAAMEVSQGVLWELKLLQGL